MFSKLTQPSDAVMWFEHMLLSGIDANATAYNILIDMFGKMKMEYEVQHWFNRMINSNISPNTSTFNILIDMYSKMDRPVEAIESYKLMIKSGVKPCVITMTSLIDMCGKLQQPEEVEKWYQAMKDWGIKPNQNTHVVMLRGSKWEVIVEHNETLEKNNWFSCISMSVFLDSCGYNDKLEIAIGFWEKIRRNYKPIMTANVYTSMIEACGRCGALEMGKEVLQQFETDGLFESSTGEEKLKLYQTYETQIVAREERINDNPADENDTSEEETKPSE